MEASREIPIVDVAALLSAEEDVSAIASAIGRACRAHGFFYVVGHGVSPEVPARLLELSREFFSWPESRKLETRMELGGRAWRGYFPVGYELTSGKPDQKEGLYCGEELPDDHPKVQAGVPLHGKNLFPALDGFRETVLAYLDALTTLGHGLMGGIALSLGLDRSYFFDRYTRNPFILFRIFNYPPLSTAASADPEWSVGEHTDYGLLTILLQDDAGGLQVKSQERWIDAPPVPGSFVCNIGDMLDRMTGGLYRSTPHRARTCSGRARLSLPFFIDPGFDVRVQANDPDRDVEDDRHERWDRSSVHNY